MYEHGPYRPLDLDAYIQYDDGPADAEALLGGAGWLEQGVVLAIRAQLGIGKDAPDAEPIVSRMSARTTSPTGL